MHPHLLSQITRQHIDDLRRSAAERTPGAAPGTGAGAAIRSRAGWALVHLGLRLAVRSADA
jgi:hypothetical protein